MRLFGLLGLVLALAIAGLLAKRQLGDTATSGRVAPVAGETGVSGASAATVRAQSQQLQQQIKQSVEAGMQPRAVPDDQ